MKMMRAIVVGHSGGVEVLKIRDDWPLPKIEPGRVMIRVMAFGLNRGEIFTRLGHSPTVSFPRVRGIECAGSVEAAPDTPFEVGETVVATTGGMGRAYDGSYAEYVSVPADHVHAVRTSLTWPELAATPELFHTAWGGLEASLALQGKQTLLIRGGSSAVGLVAANYARSIGSRVIATTRREEKTGLLRDFGVDIVVIEDGEIAEKVQNAVPGGVDAVFDLIGTQVLNDSFKCVRQGGTLCMAGMLGGEWTVENFSPGTTIPSTTKFTYFSSSSTPIPTKAFQDYLVGIENGTYRMPLDRVFDFDQIQEAHGYMESNNASGKIVVSVV